ncbi:TonB-dependent receptor [sulfur-oxidizing endosymbiont of Gigantopelta aegis]|uniref:TonB-dependent receptor n=1 Tax=sulfur-oxidizing endosymbiont of Gigantopelta aegis TaxID=2794934 RepID=UPI0018DB8642|nr:TonB-dependent receptor plug domain-containing protein [sulfur-oxidizing endosymbiont of Gigantopelta aegis]
MLTTKHTSIYFLVLCACNSFSSAYADKNIADNTFSKNSLTEITVTGTREETLRSETAETSNVLDEQEIDEVKPAHPSELLNRIPGVHVNVTGGEGHMMSIRQPITTKAVYLYLENGIPTRSTGFFNHNALYETNIPQAESVEVTKGPGTALYGSDAIGAVINVNTRRAPMDPEAELGLEGGENGWGRILLSGGNTWGDDGVRGDLNITHTDGWRDNTDYDRVAGTARWDTILDNGASLETVFSGSDIDQQTAGSSRLSEDDYKSDPTKNYLITHKAPPYFDNYTIIIL